jgi:hypothetical protein
MCAYYRMALFLYRVQIDNAILLYLYIIIIIGHNVKRRPEKLIKKRKLCMHIQTKPHPCVVPIYPASPCVVDESNS